MEYIRSPRIPENLRFVSVEEIESMRKDQQAALQEAGAQVIAGMGLHELMAKGVDLQTKAREKANQEIDQAAELYVANHLKREDNEELFDGCVDLVRRYSITNMSEGEWLAGPQQADSSFNTEESGRHRLYGELLALVESEDADRSEEEDAADDESAEEAEVAALIGSAEIAQMESDLEGARTKLAELSVQRRRLLTRSKGKKSKRLAAEYEAAEAAYNTAKLAIGKASVESLQAAGMAEDEIRNRVLAGVIAEHAAFTAAEVNYMENDNSRRGRFIRWYANKKRNMIAANVVTGVASGFAINKLAKVGLVSILPGVGLGLLAGARAGKALLTAKWGNGAQLHNDFEKRRTADTQTLTTRATEAVQTVAGGAEEYAQLFTNNTSKVIGERISADVRGNKKRAAISAAIAGSAAIVGAAAADRIHLPGSGGSSVESPQKSFDKVLQEAGVKDEALRKHIIQNPEQFGQFTESVEYIKDTTGLRGEALEKRVNDTLSLVEKLQAQASTPSTSTGKVTLVPPKL